MDATTEGIRMGIGLVMLLGATLSDVRTRRVANQYWLPFVAAAVVFAAGDWLGSDPGVLLVPYAMAGVLCLCFYAVWRLGLFGGADAKGLMVLAILLPHLRGDLIPLPSALDALANGSLLMLVLPLLFAVENAARGRWSGPAMFLGRPIPIERAESRHVWPLQRIDDAGVLRWRYRHRPGEELGPTYEALRKAGIRTVWVTPKVPFMVPLALGLAVSWVYGNLAVLAMARYLA